MGQQVSVTVATHVGEVRQENQDRVVAGPWILAPASAEVATVRLSVPCVAAVVDGMGGHAGGSVAAQLVAAVIGGAHASDLEDGEQAARSLMRDTNAAVYEEMARQPGLSGMGATVAGVIVAQDRLTIFNVGDARAYVESSGMLVPLSVDDAVPGIPGRVTQSIGGLAEYTPVEPHVSAEDVDGRRLILASDGLFGHLEDEALDDALDADDLACVTALRDLALTAGGPDNVSIALVRIDLGGGE